MLDRYVKIMAAAVLTAIVGGVLFKSAYNFMYVNFWCPDRVERYRKSCELYRNTQDLESRAGIDPIHIESLEKACRCAKGTL